MQVTSFNLIKQSEEQQLESSKIRPLRSKFIGSLRDLNHQENGNGNNNVFEEPNQLKVTPQLLKRIDFLKNTHFKLDQDVLRRLLILEQELRESHIVGDANQGKNLQRTLSNSPKFRFSRPATANSRQEARKVDKTKETLSGGEENQAEEAQGEEPQRDFRANSSKKSVNLLKASKRASMNKTNFNTNDLNKANTSGSLETSQPTKLNTMRTITLSTINMLSETDKKKATASSNSLLPANKLPEDTIKKTSSAENLFLLDVKKVFDAKNENTGTSRGKPAQQELFRVRKLNNAYNSKANTSGYQADDLVYEKKDRGYIYSRNLLSNIPEKPFKEEQAFVFTVGEGNNSELVKKVLMNRNWWTFTENIEEESINFRWHQSIGGKKFQLLGKEASTNSSVRLCYNHFEYHREISTKKLLFKNVSIYCEERKLNPFNTVPLTFCLDLDDIFLEQTLKEFVSFYSLYTERGPAARLRDVSSIFDELLREKPVAIISPAKSRSFQTKVDRGSLLKLKTIYKKNFAISPTFSRGFNTWLLKPDDYNRGRGIKVFNNLYTLKDFLTEYYNKGYEVTIKNQEGETKLKRNLRNFIIQKYIESPLLLEKRKFDIRVWVLITHNLEILFCREGYIRTSSENFDLSEQGLTNYFIHLTNNAIQKYSENYGQFEKGNQISFDDFQKLAQNEYPDINFRGNILPKMKEKIYLSFLSVKEKLNPMNRFYSFEIFGYDFIIDSEFEPWLIEVNTNPCLEESSPLLEMLIPRMLDDAFKLTLDEIFNPDQLKDFDQSKKANKNYIPVTNIEDHESIWEVLGPQNSLIK